ncbi:MAG: LytTR family transcriptional regulator [Candidatus Phocaeicola excrementipullorum]|uniref:LytTR family transcriptional regulator n=1 Tax=Candidatus Phocaeicola excrementipullorum TaxID=2838731 RepID=A0A948X1Z3_9BACT|nr:LytTR family transcriptional regulator [Candidatus Phocaeicola excrementipullorum]
MSPIHIEPKSLKNILAKWAREPYPSVISPWKVVVVPAVIIFLVLYLLQPFGIARIGSGKLWVTLGSACISAGVSSLFVWVLPWMFPRYYEERAWTLGKEVLGTLALLLCITVCVWFYVSWLCGVMPGVRLFFTVLLWVLILGAFPTVLFTMWNRNIRLARNLREATELNLRLSKKQEAEEMPSATLVFSGGTKDTLVMDARSFLYAESEGNYVRLHYLSPKDNRPVSRLLRLTMKQAEAALASAPFIVRCHRAFLVNLHQVTKMDGNSQGYRLRLEECAEEVPVSRAYVRRVKLLIESD